MQYYFFYFKADSSAGVFPLCLRIMINYMVLLKITPEQDRILPLQIYPNCTQKRRESLVIYFWQALKKLDPM